MLFSPKNTIQHVIILFRIKMENIQYIFMNLYFTDSKKKKES